jgi:hypothetical protein
MWAGVFLGAVGCYTLKALGLMVPRRVVDHPHARHIADLLPVALLAALTVTQTFSDGKDLVLDARVFGVAAALVAIRLRAPFIVVVVVASAVTAGVRALG